LINNTLVDDRRGGGIFLRVKPGQVRIKAFNNLLVGRGKLESAGPGDYRNNPNVGWEVFELATRQDYRLKPQASTLSPVVSAGLSNDTPLMPSREYVHPLQTRSVPATQLQTGALHSFKP
jgi:hypothetical protein